MKTLIFALVVAFLVSCTDEEIKPLKQIETSSGNPASVAYTRVCNDIINSIVYEYSKTNPNHAVLNVLVDDYLQNCNNVTDTYFLSIVEEYR